MKKIVFAALLLMLSISGSFAQKHFVRLNAGYTDLRPAMINGYTLEADYTTRFLGIFRLGMGINSASYLDADLNHVAQVAPMDMDFKLGIGMKIIGIRLEGGLGVFGRYVNKSYMAANESYQYTYYGNVYTLDPGQHQTYGYFTYGTLLYANIGIDATKKWGVMISAYSKMDMSQDINMGIMIGPYFLLK